MCALPNTEVTEKLQTNGRKGSMVLEPTTERWTSQDASELFDVASWGKGYFSISENGNVLVHPDKDATKYHSAERRYR